MVTVSMSKRGEIVIPKKIRERLGLKRAVTLSVKNDMIEILPQNSAESISARWERLAKSVNADPKTWIMGDALYEEEFDKEWKRVSGR